MKILGTILFLIAALAFAANPPARAQETQHGASQTKSAKAAARKTSRTARAPRTRIYIYPRVTATKRYTGTPGYGFLPGYEPPPKRPLYGPQDTHYYRGTYPWWGWPGTYRGRWNGGGFGPCWTKTPIGPMWNCG